MPAHMVHGEQGAHLRDLLRPQETPSVPPGVSDPPFLLNLVVTGLSFPQRAIGIWEFGDNVLLMEPVRCLTKVGSGNGWPETAVHAQSFPEPVPQFCSWAPSLVHSSASTKAACLHLLQTSAASYSQFMSIQHVEAELALRFAKKKSQLRALWFMPTKCPDLVNPELAPKPDSPFTQGHTFQVCSEQFNGTSEPVCQRLLTPESQLTQPHVIDLKYTRTLKMSSRHHELQPGSCGVAFILLPSASTPFSSQSQAHLCFLAFLLLGHFQNHT